MPKTSTLPALTTLVAAMILALLPPCPQAEAQTPAAQPAPVPAPAPAAPPAVAPAPAAPATPAPAAAAQPSGVGFYVAAVDLDIAPSMMIKFTAALQTDGAAMIKETGAREFDSTVAEKDKNHIFIFEAYTSSAAYASHQLTVAYNAFLAVARLMIQNDVIRYFNMVAMYTNAAAQPASGSLLVVEEELEIVPAQIGAFTTALQTHAAASVQDAGCREFDIATLGSDKNHVLLFEVYDNAAALTAHRATDHFKAYDAATTSMVTQRQGSQLSSLQMLVK